MTFDGVKPSAARRRPPASSKALLLMGSAVRSVEMAGALEAILALSVAYANERVAFERPIAKFQAVQHNLARLAGEVRPRSPRPARPPTRSPRPTFDEAVFLEAASAKIRVGEAAGEGAAIAHQVLGAIGFTQEHTLHRFTAPAVLARRLRQRELLGGRARPTCRRGAAPTTSGRWWHRDDATHLQFDPIRLPPECEALRAEVRAFLAEEIAAGTFDPHGPAMATAYNREFSRGSAPRAGSA